MSTPIVPTQRRNIAFIGQARVGSTSLIEALLFNAGATTRMGVTRDGSSHLDFEPEEIESETTLKTSVFDFAYKGISTTLLDTPGSSNFQVDQQYALRAADAAVLVVGAASGVKVQTEKAWRLVQNEGIARCIFVGELDKEHSSFEQALKGIDETLGVKPAVTFLPIGHESSLKGIVNLLSMTAELVSDGKAKAAEIPAEMKSEADEWRMKLIEQIAETDDALIEKYLEGTAISSEELLPAYKKALAAGKITPLFCGSPINRSGIQAFLDHIVEYFPSPMERKPYAAGDKEIKADLAAPFVGFVFKTFADPFTGQVSLIRVVRGTIKHDQPVMNPNLDAGERVGKFFLQQGKDHAPTEEAVAGQIIAVPKLKDTRTGHTLCAAETPVTLDLMVVPPATISFAIEPKNKGDEDKIYQGIDKISIEDPAIGVRRDSTTNETIVMGMSQGHVEIALKRIRRKFHVDMILKEPKIPYRETIKGKAEAQGRHKKQTGGHGQFGDCWLRISGRPRGAGFEFKDEIKGGAIPRNYIPAVEKGIVDSMERGYLAGYPMVDIECAVYDGSYHPVDSSEMAFKLAGSKGFKACMAKLKMILLEPVMSVEIVVPDDCTGAIMGDLNSRRGRVHNMETKGHQGIVLADVPLAEMLTYSSDLLSMTADRGAFRMEFKSYEEVPAHITEKIVANYKREDKEDED